LRRKASAESGSSLRALLPDSFASSFLDETARIARELDASAVEAMAAGLAGRRDRGGRLFVIGVGGGAGHASHAVCDFRKLAAFEAYTPVDNVSELTARTNDEGWETSFEAWLRTSRLSERDALLVFSVGGGSREHAISLNLVRAVEHACDVGAAVFGVVGRADGTTAQLADACVVVPAPPERLTPHAEAWQAVVWHLLVSHPALAAQATKWESVDAATR
jgi:D-sedoheptulose 7-phosphate isomerase